MIRAILISLLIYFSSHALAEKAEAARGTAYGVGHAFSMKAPNGWVIDTDSGARDGIGLVFYPVGKKWTTSRVILYVRGRPKDNEVASVDGQVKWTLRDFQTNGHPNYQAAPRDDLQANANRVAKVFYFTGDNWGNHEAIAYFDEQKTINFLVLNTRTKEEFVASLPIFEQIAESYQFLGD